MIEQKPALIPLFPVPPVLANVADAVASDSFLLRGGLVDAWFIRRSDVLLVTFDNLGSVGEYEPPQPWLQGRAAKGDFSILGLMASRKDWYRNQDTPRLITALRDAGLFNGFRRVVFVGASMGGFAALTYSALVPGSVVLAFSPQTSLARSVAPFEKRYRYAARKWDWQSPDFLDAAESAAQASEVHLFYDPFVPEDLAHASRVSGPRVKHYRMGHMGHRAIRVIKSIGMLQVLIEGVARGTLDGMALARGLRKRRDEVAWQRALVAEAERRSHHRLAGSALERLILDNPDSKFPRRAAKRLRGQSRETFAEVPPDSVYTVSDPKPKRPFTGKIALLSQALVVPERGTDKPLACGVIDNKGAWCALSKGWVRARKAYLEPSVSDSEPIEDLAGTHLYAGHFRGHFGHFLVEATARLWAYDHVETKPDSIIYLPYRGEVGPTMRVMRDMAPFFEFIGLDVPIRTYGTVQRVERLIVPELGFGWGERYAGSPAYRRFMQGRLSAAAKAEGGEKLYISRALLNAERGGIIGEAVIEENLARLGYEIFHPEKHPIAVQVARYKAARQIVALDGSALHFAAYLAHSDLRVAMILRRSTAETTNALDYIRQYQSFAGVTPDIIQAIRHDWVTGDASRIDYKSIGEVDFVALFAQLAELGYVPPDFRPDLPTETEMRAMLRTFEDKRGQPFQIVHAN